MALNIGKFSDLLEASSSDVDTLESLATTLKAVTGLEDTCETSLITEFEKIVSKLSSATASLTSESTTTTQSLVLNAGIVVTVVAKDLSFTEEASQLAKVLETNRGNCDGMDKASTKIEEFVEKTKTCTTGETATALSSVIANILDLVSYSSADLEDSKIATLSATIVTQISATTAACVSETDMTTVKGLTSTIKKTVVTYVSQIGLVEQRRLSVTGELTFTTSAATTASEEEKDKASLKGLMQCGDFTDRSTDAIATVTAATTETVYTGTDGCTGTKFVNLAQKQTGMCSSANLDLDAIRTVSVEIVQCSKKLSTVVTKSDLTLIESALKAFRITFSNEITNVQQSLAIITGKTLTAADLDVSFVDPEGGSEPIKAKAVDFTDGGKLTEGSAEFLEFQWQQFRYTFSTLTVVKESISKILEIKSVNTNSIKASEFFKVVTKYYSIIGSGNFLESELETVMKKIVEYFGKVNIPSGSDRLFLTGISKGLSGYEMACASEFANIQTKLEKMSSLKIEEVTFKEFKITGDAIIEKEGKATAIDETKLKESKTRFESMDTCVSAAVKNDFTSITTATVEVASTVFIKELKVLMIAISTDINGIDVSIFDKFVTYKLKEAASDKQIDSFKSISNTLIIYIELSTTITTEETDEATEKPGVTKGPEDTEEPGATEEGEEEGEEPGVTKGPGETEKPGVTKGPGDTEEGEDTIEDPKVAADALKNKINIINKKITLTKTVSTITISIIKGELKTVSGSGTSCDGMALNIGKFSDLLEASSSDVDTLESLATTLKAVTGLEDTCETSLITEFEKIVSKLSSATASLTSESTTTTQSLVLNAGIVVTVVAKDLSFTEEASQLAKVLETNRGNCDGMDKASTKIEEFVEKTKTCTTGETATALSSVIANILDLVSYSSADLEDSKIATLSATIVTQISATTAACVSETDMTTVKGLTSTIKKTVVTYVSQIGLVEQRRLSVTGELTFTTSAATTASEEEKDKASLKGLMQCGDFTDRSTDAIATVTAATTETVYTGTDGCTGTKFVNLAQKQTGMCSSANLDLDAIRTVSVEIVQCSKKLSTVVTKSDLTLIESALKAFRITFSNEITNVQQSLAIITGKTLTAADLDVSFVDPEGGSEPIKAKAVDFTDGGKLTEGSAEFLEFQWQQFRYTFSTLTVVKESISKILEIKSVNTNSIKASEFFKVVTKYYSIIGSGNFLESELETVMKKIVEYFGKVNIPSGSDRLFLTGISKGLSGYEMACASEFANIQTKLEKMSSLKIEEVTFKEFKITGDAIIEKEGKATAIDETKLKESKTRFESMDTCVSAAVKNDFTSITTATVEVASTVFIKELKVLMIAISTDINGIDVSIFDKFVTYKLKEAASDKQIDSFKSISNTLIIYIELSTTITTEETDEATEKPGVTKGPGDTEEPGATEGPEDGVTDEAKVPNPQDLEDALANKVNDLKIKVESTTAVKTLVKTIMLETITIVSTSTSEPAQILILIQKFLTLLESSGAASDLKTQSSTLSIITSIKIAFTSEQKETLASLQLKLVGASIGLASESAAATQNLILSKGVIVTDVPNDIEFSEMETALAAVLEINRGNCEGMDKVGNAVEEIIKGRSTCGENEKSSGFASLISSLADLVSLSVENLEDTNILSMSTTTITEVGGISSSSCIAKSETEIIEGLIITIQSTVLTYVSQIALVEQRKLSVGGGLTFSISLGSSASPEERGKAELSGLMQCGDFTDRGTESIKTSIRITEEKLYKGPDGCSGKTFKRIAQKQTGMCGAANLDLDAIREVTTDLVKCKTKLSSVVSKDDFKLVLASLTSFRITFSSEISIVQQKLYSITGKTISIADLDISFVNPDGSDKPFTPKPVDFTNGGKFDLDADPEGFYTFQWQEFRYSFSLMGVVQAAISRVVEIDAPNANDVLASDFLGKIVTFYTLMGNGIFLKSELREIAEEIVADFGNVNIASNSELLAFKAISGGLSGFQMDCVSQFSVIQQKLAKFESKSSLTIVFEEYIIIGGIVEFGFTEALPEDESNPEEAKKQLGETSERLSSMDSCVAAAIKNDFSSISTATVEVSSTVFIAALNQLLIATSTSINGLDVSVFEEFVTYKLKSAASSKQLQSLQITSTTLTSYQVQVFAQTTSISFSVVNSVTVEVDATDSAALSAKVPKLEATLEDIKKTEMSVSLIISSENDNAVTVTDLFKDLLPFLSALGKTTAFEDFDTTEAKALVETINKGVRIVPASFRLLIDSVSIMINVYVSLIEIQIVIIKKTVFLLSSSCDKTLANPIGDLSDESGFCCCGGDSTSEPYCACKAEDPNAAGKALANKLNTLNLVIRSTVTVHRMIVQILIGSFVVESDSKYTCENLFDLVDQFVNILLGSGDASELGTIVEKLLAIDSISSPCSSVIIIKFKSSSTKIVTKQISMTSETATVTQSLVILRGIIVTRVSKFLPFGERAAQLGVVLETNRGNCDGMDRAANSAEDKLSKASVCASGETSGFGDILSKLVELTTLSSADLEDPAILNISMSLMKTLEEFTAGHILCKEESDITTITSVIKTIKTTVVTYVSQIALVEQQRLSITGELTFSISVSKPGEDDIKGKEKRDKAQLSGLMQCGDFTDRSTESIKTAIGIKTDALYTGSDGCSGDKFLQLAQKQTGMCSSANLDLEAIRAVSVETVQCSLKLSSVVEENEFKLVLSALTSFRVTFTTEITNVQQRLFTLTGVTFSAADINVTFVDPEGGSEPIMPKPVDFSNDGKLNKETDPIGFFKYQWQEFRYAFSTMKVIQESIALVIKIEEPNTNPIKSSELFQAINSYYTLIGKGLFLRSELEVLTKEIVSYFGKVNIASEGELLILESISGGLQGYQMACVSEFVKIQQKLSEYAAVGSLDVIFEEYTVEEGSITLEIVSLKEPKDQIIYKSELLETTGRFRVIMSCISAAIEGNFEFLEDATLEVSSTEFIADLNQLLLVTSIDLTGMDIKLFERFSKFKLESEPSDKQLGALRTTMFTVVSYQLQTFLIASEVSKEIELSMTNELSIKNVDELIMEQQMLMIISRYLEIAHTIICNVNISAIQSNYSNGEDKNPTKMPTTEMLTMLPGSTKAPGTKGPDGEVAVELKDESVIQQAMSIFDTVSDNLADFIDGEGVDITEVDITKAEEHLEIEEEDLVGLPSSYQQGFNTLCQIISTHLTIVEIRNMTINKNIFLIEEDCNPNLEEPVGTLYNKPGFCCCSGSSDSGLRPVMTTSRGSRPFMTTMRMPTKSMMTTMKAPTKSVMTTKRSSIKTMMTTMRSPMKSMMTTMRMPSKNHGKNPNCKCSMSSKSS